jgi:predicted GNAT family N-acyltransferase
MTAKTKFAEPFEAVALPKAAIAVSVARTLDDLMQAMAIRSVVYMGEQLCPYDEEFDGNDLAGATHLIARIGSQPVGVIRLRWFCDFAKLERLTVLPN